MNDDEQVAARHEALRTVAQFKQFIGLCRCGTPEAFLREVQVGLEAYAPAGQPDPERVPAGRGGWSPATNTAHMMTMYLLDCWDLTEHGTALPGGWLTADGIRLRDAFRLVDLTDGSGDLDSLLPGGAWWTREWALHPRGRDGSGIGSVGDWEPADG